VGNHPGLPGPMPPDPDAPPMPPRPRCPPETRNLMSVATPSVTFPVPGNYYLTETIVNHGVTDVDLFAVTVWGAIPGRPGPDGWPASPAHTTQDLESDIRTSAAGCTLSDYTTPPNGIPITRADAMKIEALDAQLCSLNPGSQVVVTNHVLRVGPPSAPVVLDPAPHYATEIIVDHGVTDVYLFKVTVYPPFSPGDTNFVLIERLSDVHISAAGCTYLDEVTPFPVSTTFTGAMKVEAWDARMSSQVVVTDHWLDFDYNGQLTK
jgi:hypothetical protein